ncbi:MAG: phosphomannomutase/phosphoglucomutase [Patescibacteria group bacterium]
MEIPRSIFKAYDIRGLVDEVSPEIAKLVGVAVVDSLKAKRIVVGRDMRSSSPALYEAVIAGARAKGCDVRGLGMCTTSLFNYAVCEMDDVDGGVMITASHNPSQYNGIKMADHKGVPISGEEIYSRLSESTEGSYLEGKFEEVNIIKQYLSERLRQGGVLDAEGVKIVVDYGNGMGSVTIAPLLQKIGAEVVELFAQPDASFPNHEANPAKVETLVDLQQTVIKENADFGIAIDGDGDRIGFIDEKGLVIRGDIMLALFAKDALQRKSGESIVVQPNHSWTTTHIIEKFGGKIIPCRIGRTFMIQKMHEYSAVVGGELSSHFFFRECNGLESIDFVLLKVVSILKESGQPFSKLFQDFEVYENSGEMNFEVRDKQVVLDAFENEFVGSAKNVDKIDGLKFEFSSWWFIVRSSNTEPLIRLTIEASSKDELSIHRDELVSFLQQFKI